MTLETAIKLLKEIVHHHQLYFHPYKHNIPSRFLPETAGVYLEAFEKARTEARTQTDLNRIITAEVLYRDFKDPTGDDEMTKLFTKLENNPNATWIK